MLAISHDRAAQVHADGSNSWPWAARRRCRAIFVELESDSEQEKHAAQILDQLRPPAKPFFFELEPFLGSMSTLTYFGLRF